MILRVRRVGPRSLGTTISEKDIEAFDIEEGDLLDVDVKIIKGTIFYTCGVCNYDFSQDVNELMPQCPACGETQHLMRISGSEEDA